MNIKGKITGIKYKVLLAEELKIIFIDQFDINKVSPYCIVNDNKHSKNAILPSIGDIKDGLLKMILYSNLCEVEVDGVLMQSQAVLNNNELKIKKCA
jgi:hypothetical protein